MSKDKKRFYLDELGSEEVEILDIATRKSIDHFTLSEGRQESAHPQHDSGPARPLRDPAHEDRPTKQIDRFEIGAPTLVVYDLKEHKVTRTIPWPNNEEREFTNIMFSPDGKLLYFFGDDVLIYDTTDFKQVDKWELSRPLEEGLRTASTSDRATSPTRSRGSTAASSRCRIRCRIAGSWASRA